MTALQSDAIEDASIALYQIAATADLICEHMDQCGRRHATLSNVLAGAAAYARLQAERLDRLETLED